jgi:hypothetical protein
VSHQNGCCCCCCCIVIDLRNASTFFFVFKNNSPENFLAYDDFDNTPNVGGRRKTWSPHVTDFRSGDPTWQSGKGTGIIGAVNYLSNEGMNVFSFLTLNINGDDENVFPYISDAPGSDRLRMDVSKLAQWEILFAHADTMGMYLHFKLMETENDSLLDGGALGNERKLYYREIIARFGHHLALNWNLSEEISLPIDKIKEFADFVKATDPYNHIVLFHTGSNSDLYTDFLGYPSIDGASLQDNPANVFANTIRWVLQSAATGQKWVVANDEQNPASSGVLPDSVDPDHDNIRIDSLWGNIMVSTEIKENQLFSFFLLFLINIALSLRLVELVWNTTSVTTLKTRILRVKISAPEPTCGNNRGMRFYFSTTTRFHFGL